MSILQKLFYGKIEPCEKPVSQNPEFEKIQKRTHDLQKCFTGRFSDEDKRNFDRFLSSMNEADTIEREEHFIAGFKLGARFFAEAMFNMDTEIPAELINSCRLLFEKQNKENAESLNI